MKKLLFVLACAASLGLWISCNNGAQDVNLKLDTGLIEKGYTNYGTVTATKVTMVTKNTGIKVTYDGDYEPNNKPAGDKDYYISSVYKKESTGEVVYDGSYWFYNEWDAGTEVTFESASVSWGSNVGYDRDGIVGYENVSNGKMYRFLLENKDDVTAFKREYALLACGNVVTLQYNDYTDYNWNSGTYIRQDFSTTPLNVDGSLEGSFTIKGSLKARDWCYDDYKKIRFDVHLDSDGEKIEPYGGVYYLKDVKFTKN